MTDAPKDNSMISSNVEIDYPDFTKLPAPVREKFDSLPTKVNFFRMLGHSAGAFIPVIDLTNAIFRDLTISDYHKELMVLMVGAHENVAYEWEQHVSIAQAAGVRQDQFIAIAEGQIDDTDAFKEDERVLLRFGKSILDKGKAPGVLFKHALRHFSVQDLSTTLAELVHRRLLAAYGSAGSAWVAVLLAGRRSLV